MTDPALDDAMNAAMNPPGENYICDAELELGTVIYNDFHGPAVIDRLQSYEQRIESSLFKTIRQFQQMQDTRIKQDTARNKIEWSQLCIENEERKNRREDEYQQSMRNKPNPNTDDSPDDEPLNELQEYEPLNAQNEPNSDVTSITEMTYNRSRYAKEKLDEGQSRRAGDPERPSSPQNQ